MFCETFEQSPSDGSISNESTSDKRKKYVSKKSRTVAKKRLPLSPNTTPVKQTETMIEDSDDDEETSIIRENNYVLLHMPSGNVKVVKLQRDTTVSLGKFGTFHTNDIIGRRFGHSYEIYDGDKVKVIKNIAFTEINEETSDANNRHIMDDPSKQKLSYSDIEKLKKEGIDGQEIIKKVVESHESFESKTEYSKAKYIRRKEAKFSRIFTPVRPTLYSVWEYFFKKNPGKIRDMRIDTLSQILTLANVHSNTKMLVVDDTQGLVISGVMERLGGYGIVLGVHDNENHNYDIVRYMNFSTRINESLRPLSWQQVFKEDDEPPFEFEDELTLSENDLKGYLRRKAAHYKLQEARELLWKGGFDGLIIASQYQPESTLEALIQYVAGSRPIVIYHINKEVLVNTCVQMRISKHYLNPQVSESWLRDYQVLPGRTHPEMTTTGGGGYILSSIRVLVDDRSQPTHVNNNVALADDEDESSSNVGKRVKIE